MRDAATGRWAKDPAQPNITPLVPKPPDQSQESIRLLQMEVNKLQKEKLSETVIRNEILKIAHVKPPVPSWLTKVESGMAKSPGVPTLFASDWHWAEVVDPSQIGGVNKFNLKIAHERVRALISQTIDLLDNHMVNPEYPGIVFALGGDMMSGFIHPELVETNEVNVMASLVDLFGVMSWAIEMLADRYGKVFVPCVTGNHGRSTVKIQAKNRHHTSFDWLLYCLLDKRFENDPRITMHIPDGPDALYSVYDTRYLLTHGDQFRGGDGLIGCLGPIIRGDHKKRSRNAQIDMDYTCMILGHWHQLIQMQRLIVNGSLIGYNEYAYAGNFGFEIPQQALWITHPKNGITFQMAVKLGGKHDQESRSDWISWRAA